MTNRQSWINEFENVFNKYTDSGWTACIGYPWETLTWAYQLVNSSSPVRVPAQNLLLVTNFMCEYRKEAAAALTFKMSENTYREKLWSTVKRLEKSLPKVISSCNRYSLIKLSFLWITDSNHLFQVKVFLAIVMLL